MAECTTQICAKLYGTHIQRRPFCVLGVGVIVIEVGVLHAGGQGQQRVSGKGSLVTGGLATPSLGSPSLPPLTFAIANPMQPGAMQRNLQCTSLALAQARLWQRKSG